MTNKIKMNVFLIFLGGRGPLEQHMSIHKKLKHNMLAGRKTISRLFFLSLVGVCSLWTERLPGLSRDFYLSLSLDSDVSSSLGAWIWSPIVFARAYRCGSSIFTKVFSVFGVRIVLSLVRSSPAAFRELYSDVWRSLRPRWVGLPPVVDFVLSGWSAQVWVFSLSLVGFLCRAGGYFLGRRGSLSTP